MKKCLLISIALMGVMSITSCNNKWSWWEDKNVTIDRYISKEDAMDAFESSSEHAILVDTAIYKETYNTYYKDYLAKFSTEVDSNVSSSTQASVRRYKNNIIHTQEKTDYEVSYLNAKSVDSKQVNIFSIFDDLSKTIYVRTITEREKGNVSGEEAYLALDDESYIDAMTIGSTLSPSSIVWDNATYGYAKNGEIIIETMFTTNDEYKIQFNGNVITRVLNRYTMYRFKSFKDIADNTVYFMDYTYSKTEVLTGRYINGEALSDPYLLEKRETSTTYQINGLENYDTNNIIPMPEQTA